MLADANIQLYICMYPCLNLLKLVSGHLMSSAKEKIDLFYVCILKENKIKLCK